MEIEEFADKDYWITAGECGREVEGAEKREKSNRVKKRPGI